MSQNLEEKLTRTPAGELWKKIGIHHHHGFALPLFSLHSEKSCGIGEFLDLIPMIDWCKSLGMDVIQLLPLNDTGLETSPYNALSAFALNPIFLSLHALPGLEKIAEYKEKLAKIQYWNRTQKIKYHIVRELKYQFFKEYFALLFSEISASDAYKKFRAQNLKWLEPYALFKTLKEKQQWRNWEEWPLELKSPSITSYKQLLEENSDGCRFHEFLQYLSFDQMEKVKRYAEEKKVLIKGDVPILISKDSSDVWHFRHYFLLGLAAGAPPDLYAKDGQYWGFPVYDWECLEKNQYDWWKDRLDIASHLYHLYRLDHIVGFFRIWSIPLGKSAREGAYIPSQEDTWIFHGKKIMEMMLKSASILPIGEDLGTVPPVVKKCLYDMGICGTKMMRWERRWDEDGGFISPQDYEPMTMTTVSTHDSDTLQQWWRHFPKEAKLFSEYKGWDFRPFLSKERHLEILRDSHHSASLFHINLLLEYLAVFPEMVSLNLNDERINIPGKTLDTNWTYRFRLTVEEITEHVPLKETISSLLR